MLFRSLFGDSLVAFGSDLLRGLGAIPQWIVDVVLVGTRILAVIVIGGGFVVTVARARWRMLLTVTAGAVLAVVLDLLRYVLIDAGQGDVPVDVATGLGPLTDTRFPTVAGLAATTAVLTAAAPWLSRRWRRYGWLLVVGLALTRFLASPVSFDTLDAFVVGWLSGAADPLSCTLHFTDAPSTHMATRISPPPPPNAWRAALVISS